MTFAQYRTHRFLLAHSFYSISLLSALAVSALIVRIYSTGRVTFCFMLWNLALAWVPYVLSLGATLAQQYIQSSVFRRITCGVLGTLWLLFFPNGPYIVTDLIHLAHRPPVPMWYDAIVLATFAITGVFLGVASLCAMQRLVRARWGHSASWLFGLASLLLAGVGVYIGRFLRWNSWDVLSQPGSVITSMEPWFRSPLALRQPVVFVVVFTAFFFVCYALFVEPRALRTSSSLDDH
jgi:uncharacterized membrane protein